MTRTVTDISNNANAAPALQTLDITVLAGGVGVERDVSLRSGRMVRDALKRIGQQAIMLDIGPEDLTALDVPADMIFVALHGAFGEDGEVQRILESRRLPYSGSGVESSRVAMDKVRSKIKFIENEIATPRFDLIKPARVAQAAADMDLPVVVKPRASGSSVDTFIVHDRARLTEVLEEVTGRYGSALVEQFVDGPELTVGILGDLALPVCQIRTPREFYDYQAKYLDDDTEYLFDIDLPETLLERVRALSLRAHQAIGCRDFSRVDWMVDAETIEPYAIEINTIPGLTDHSLLPKAAARVGLSFETLCRRVLEMTMRRTSR